MAVAATFLDTSVLLGGLLDFGPQSAPAHSVMHARVPPLARRAAHLLDAEVFARMCVHEPPSADRIRLFAAAAPDGTAAGRICGAHVAEVARAIGAQVIVTDNRRHFLASLRHGIRVETPAEFLRSLKARRG